MTTCYGCRGMGVIPAMVILEIRENISFSMHLPELDTTSTKLGCHLCSSIHKSTCCTVNQEIKIPF